MPGHEYRLEEIGMAMEMLAVPTLLKRIFPAFSDVKYMGGG